MNKKIIVMAMIALGASVQLNAFSDFIKNGIKIAAPLGFIATYSKISTFASQKVKQTINKHENAWKDLDKEQKKQMPGYSLTKFFKKCRKNNSLKTAETIFKCVAPMALGWCLDKILPTKDNYGFMTGLFAVGYIGLRRVFAPYFWDFEKYLD